ncbi:MAG TPA: hypothetical protein VGR14_10555 [Verrucomicrobiae bacterium]|jgi:hypothetical protein|nr:hypothetical protein [Verrucomicrobiae bacterium]
MNTIFWEATEFRPLPILRAINHLNSQPNFCHPHLEHDHSRNFFCGGLKFMAMIKPAQMWLDKAQLAWEESELLGGESPGTQISNLLRSI